MAIRTLEELRASVHGKTISSILSALVLVVLRKRRCSQQLDIRLKG